MKKNILSFLFFVLIQLCLVGGVSAAVYTGDVVLELNFEDSSKRSLITNDSEFQSNPYTADDGTLENRHISELRLHAPLGPNFSTWVSGSGGSGTFAPNIISWDNGSNIKYWYLSFSTIGYEDLNLSSKQQSSSTGPRDFKVEWSLDGITWSDVEGSNITVASDFTSGVLYETPLPPEINNNEIVYLRWIMTSNISVSGGTVGSSGTNRIDDILVRGRLKTYTINYDGNGNTGGMVPESQTKEHGVSTYLNSNIGLLEKTGYIYSGWNTSLDGSGTGYGEGESFNQDEDTTLYANWIANNYTVTFDGNGSTLGSMGEQTFVYDVEQNLFKNEYEREGYSFSGWNSDQSGMGNNYLDEAGALNLTNENNGTVILYAQWLRNSYIQEIVNSAEIGETVVVPTGTHHECLILDKPITLIGQSATSSIINISECSNGIEITSSNVSLRNLTLKNDNDNYGERGQTYAIRIGTQEIISTFSIENITMSDGKFDKGVYVSNASGEIKNSDIQNFCSGIYLDEVSNLIISGNNISNNGKADECAEASGEPSTGIDIFYGSNVLIRNNIIHNNDVGIYSYSNCEGEGCSSGILVVNNKITDNDGYVASSWEYMSRDPYEIRNDGNNPVLASMNWWGSETGPHNISSEVNYSPWFYDEEMTSLKGNKSEEGEIIVSNDFSVSVNDIELSIPANTIITGSSGWLGRVNPPTLIDSLDNNPSLSGFSTTVRTKIEVGFPSEKLLLSRAVKLTFPGEAGKRVGYTRPDNPFVEITSVCGENSQAWADANLATEGDCKIDSGFDMVVWTKHFTQFATYTMTQNVSNDTDDNDTTPSTSSDSGVAGAGPSSIGFVRTYPVAVVQSFSAPLDDVNDKKSIFTIDMYLGLRHDEVRMLQKYLSTEKDIYPEGYITGFYGPLTVKSVKAFQKKYGISQVGRVGPITRDKLNEVFSGVTLSISQEEYLSIKDQIRILQEKINELMKLL